jgi:hypothetical protein
VIKIDLGKLRRKTTACEEEDWLGERELELLCGKPLLEES